MKKTIIAILTTFLLFLALSNNSINARKIEQLENLISLDNILVYNRNYKEDEYNRRKIVTINPIKVESGEDYTIVVHRSWFHYQEWIEDRIDPVFPYAIIYMFNDGNESNGDEIEVEPIRDQGVNSPYMYYMFTATKDNLEIIELAVGDDRKRNPGLMLYKGTINDFDYFISYKSEINYEKGVFIVDYDNQIALEEIFEEFTFVDDVDDDINCEVIYNEYNIKNDIGYYDVYFFVEDKSFNKRFYNLSIHVVDIVPPIVYGTEVYNINIGEELDLAMLSYNFQIQDNHTDITNNYISIVKDEYTSNKDKVGKYEVTYKIEDKSKNSTYFSIEVNVIDDVKPIIEGPRDIIRYVGDPKLTIEDYKKLYSAWDDVDGDLTDNIVVVKDYDPNVPGDYDMFISVKDSSNNEQKFLIYVVVMDGSSPTIETGDLILSYSAYSKMEIEDIIDWLQQQHQNAYNINVLYNEADYIKDSSDVVYVYYSYTIDNQVYYNRIAIQPNSKLINNDTIIYVGFALINIVFITIYTLRKKKLIDYL